MVEVLKEKYINEAEVLTTVDEEGNTWMTPIYEYLTEETLPAEKKRRQGWYGLNQGVRRNQWSSVQEIFSWAMATM
ncbi:hypothetical protein Tco_1242958, partial [Tanacetum coccineum]